MDYSKLSDSQINREVAAIIFSGDQNITPYSHRPDVQVFHKNGCNTIKDYCNNPVDAWPIILEQRIALMPDASEHGTSEWWNAQSSCQKYGLQYQANPLRAAMIVYLMMQEGE